MKKRMAFRYSILVQRERTPRKLCYLYVFPADRLGGWLCDGNDTRGMAMLERQIDAARQAVSAPEHKDAVKDIPAAFTF